MNGFGFLIILGVLMYVLLSKNGSMGCCSGHAHHDRHGRKMDPSNGNRTSIPRAEGEIIDLKLGEYEVISEESVNKKARS